MYVSSLFLETVDCVEVSTVMSFERPPNGYNTIRTVVQIQRLYVLVEELMSTSLDAVMTLRMAISISSVNWNSKPLLM